MACGQYGFIVVEGGGISMVSIQVGHVYFRQSMKNEWKGLINWAFNKLNVRPVELVEMAPGHVAKYGVAFESGEMNLRFSTHVKAV